MPHDQERTHPTGTISSILGVVGRELQQFVLSAAGLSESQNVSSKETLSVETNRRKRKVDFIESDEDADHPQRKKRARALSVRTVGQEDSNLYRKPTHPHIASPTLSISSPQHRLKRDTPPNSDPQVRNSFTMPGGLYELSPTLKTSDQHSPRVRFETVNTSSVTRDIISSTLEQTNQPDRVPRPLQSHGSWRIYRERNPQQSTSQTDEEKSPTFSYPIDTDHTPLSSPPRSSIAYSFGRHLSHDKSISVSSTSERSFEQERIKELEQEVQKLKEELARRPLNSRTPVPPPPPPLPSKSTVRNDVLTRGPNTLLSNARASLKSTADAAPKSKEITGNMRSTVPADQMAAFLDEIKTVRLRKVHTKDSDHDFISNTISSIKQIPGISGHLGAKTDNNYKVQSIKPSESSESTQPAQTSRVRTIHGNGRMKPVSPSSDSKIGDSTKSASHNMGNHREGPTTSKHSPSRKLYQLTTRDDSRHYSSGSLAAAMVNRPINNKLPSLSPHRPRPLGRSRESVGTSQKTSIDDPSDEEDPLMLLGTHSATHRLKAQSKSSQDMYDDKNPISSRIGVSSRSMATDNNVSSLEMELKRTLRVEVERDLQRQARLSEERGSSTETSVNGRDHTRTGQAHKQQQRKKGAKTLW
ncbi:hypothetical protein CPB86DRAFT_559601 [Serendipita vermifera]|nr:hypothetical protein CPB86DRAFT_559601 [Serendipita vermifera]